MRSTTARSLGWGWRSRGGALPCGVDEMRRAALAREPCELERMFSTVASAGYDPGRHAAHHLPVRARSHPRAGDDARPARGASRFAYNQCLQLITDALATKRTDPQVRVPWSGFDLINAYNGWRGSEAAGGGFVAAPDGTITKQVTGLAWRHAVSAQVFEEAAVDLGRALSAYSHAKAGTRKGRRGGVPTRQR